MSGHLHPRKIFNFFVILCPKLRLAQRPCMSIPLREALKRYIWILTVDIGIVFLMETSEIEESRRSGVWGWTYGCMIGVGADRVMPRKYAWSTTTSCVA